MKKVALVILIIFTLYGISKIHLVKITIETVDENGVPVENVVIAYGKNTSITNSKGKANIITNLYDGHIG